MKRLYVFLVGFFVSALLFFIMPWIEHSLVHADMCLCDTGYVGSTPPGFQTTQDGYFTSNQHYFDWIYVPGGSEANGCGSSYSNCNYAIPDDIGDGQIIIQMSGNPHVACLYINTDDRTNWYWCGDYIDTGRRSIKGLAQITLVDIPGYSLSWNWVSGDGTQSASGTGTNMPNVYSSYYIGPTIVYVTYTPTIRGWIDGVNCSTQQITGWTCDGTSPGSSTDMHMYFDEDAPLIGDPNWKWYGTTANLPSEQAVADQCGGGYNHRYSLTIPDSLMNNQPHTMYGYGIGVDPNQHAELNGSGGQFTCPVPPPSGSISLSNNPCIIHWYDYYNAAIGDPTGYWKKYECANSTEPPYPQTLSWTSKFLTNPRVNWRTTNSWWYGDSGSFPWRGLSTSPAFGFGNSWWSFDLYGDNAPTAPFRSVSANATSLWLIQGVTYVDMNGNNALDYGADWTFSQIFTGNSGTTWFPGLPWCVWRVTDGYGYNCSPSNVSGSTGYFAVGDYPDGQYYITQYGWPSGNDWRGRPWSTWWTSSVPQYFPLDSTYAWAAGPYGAGAMYLYPYGNATVYMGITPYIDVRGTVTNSLTGAPIPNVGVTICRGDGSSVTVYTNASGQYTTTTPWVHPGMAYCVRIASATGYNIAPGAPHATGTGSSGSSYENQIMGQGGDCNGDPNNAYWYGGGACNFTLDPTYHIQGQLYNDKDYNRVYTNPPDVPVGGTNFASSDPTNDALTYNSAAGTFDIANAKNIGGGNYVYYSPLPANFYFVDLNYKYLSSCLSLTPGSICPLNFAISDSKGWTQTRGLDVRIDGTNSASSAFNSSIPPSPACGDHNYSMNAASWNGLTPGIVFSGNKQFSVGADPNAKVSSTGWQVGNQTYNETYKINKGALRTSYQTVLNNITKNNASTTFLSVPGCNQTGSCSINPGNVNVFSMPGTYKVNGNLTIQASQLFTNSTISQPITSGMSADASACYYSDNTSNQANCTKPGSPWAVGNIINNSNWGNSWNAGAVAPPLQWARIHFTDKTHTVSRVDVAAGMNPASQPNGSATVYLIDAGYTTVLAQQNIALTANAAWVTATFAPAIPNVGWITIYYNNSGSSWADLYQVIPYEPASTPYTILVSGDVTISGGAKIRVPQGNFLSVIAKGNITFDSSIGSTPSCNYASTNQAVGGPGTADIEGFYSADGNITIGSNPNLNCSASPAVPDLQLNVQGALVAGADPTKHGAFINNRNLCTSNSYPALTLTERPDLILNTPDFFKYQTNILQETAP